MPTYALLGATGSTGAAILRCLLKQPPTQLTLNIFVRSRAKLNKIFPDLEETAGLTINIVEGTPDNSQAMATCLKDVDVIMACIATNVSTAGVTVAYDTAAAIVGALKLHRESQGSTYRPPTIIQLRSVSLNPVFKAEAPWIASTVAMFCFHYVYTDLARGCDLYVSSEEQSPGLLNYIFVDPPAIHDADGTTPTGFDLILKGPQTPVLSYADLGVAFCEIAGRKDEFYGKGVAPSATGAVNQTWGVLMGYMFQGAKSRIWG